nr:MAG TPA: hypothetical protein [Caudoviricetes sp.]
MENSQTCGKPCGKLPHLRATCGKPCGKLPQT